MSTTSLVSTMKFPPLLPPSDVPLFFGAWWLDLFVFVMFVTFLFLSGY